MTEAISIPAERTGQPAPADLAERRAMIGGAASAMLGAVPGPVNEETIAGIRVVRVLPQGGAPRGTLLMLHGGGYRLGRPEMNVAFARRLADRCGLEVVLPVYRLAPENPFPAGLNDALTVLKAVAAGNGDKPLFVGGDSAGGGLAAAVAVVAGAQGLARFAGAILLSPWLDLTITAPSYKENYATDPLFNEDAATAASGLYLQGLDPRHPVASPLFADLASFPPSFINAGTGESLRDDAVAFDSALKAAGGASTLLLVPDMEHTAVVRGTDLTGSAESFEALAAFVDGILG